MLIEQRYITSNNLKKYEDKCKKLGFKQILAKNLKPNMILLCKAPRSHIYGIYHDKAFPKYYEKRKVVNYDPKNNNVELKFGRQKRTYWIFLHKMSYVWILEK